MDHYLDTYEDDRVYCFYCHQWFWEGLHMCRECEELVCDECAKYPCSNKHEPTEEQVNG